MIVTGQQISDDVEQDCFRGKTLVANKLMSN